MKIWKVDPELAIWFVVDSNTVTEDITISKSLMFFFLLLFFSQKKAKPEKKELGVITYNITTPAGEKKGECSLCLSWFVYYKHIPRNLVFQASFPGACTLKLPYLSDHNL